MHCKIIFYLLFMVLNSKIIFCNEYGMDENSDLEATAITDLRAKNVGQCQPRLKTLEEVREILDQQPCILFENEIQNQNLNRRQKRLFGGGNDETKNHINAIYGKITEHHDMINVLTNSSINTTIMLNAIRDHHAFTLPNLSSWRDLTQLFLVLIVLLTVLYILCYGSRLRLARKLLLCVAKKTTFDVQEKQLHELIAKQQQQLNRLEQLFEEFKQKDLAHEKKASRRKHVSPSMPSVNSDTAEHNPGYSSE